MEVAKDFSSWHCPPRQHPTLLPLVLQLLGSIPSTSVHQAETACFVGQSHYISSLVTDGSLLLTGRESGKGGWHGANMQAGAPDWLCLCVCTAPDPLSSCPSHSKQHWSTCQEDGTAVSFCLGSRSRHQTLPSANARSQVWSGLSGVWKSLSVYSPLTNPGIQNFTECI